MWPWAHAVFGYCGYILARPRAIKHADRYALLAALFGSQFPDAVDKPLAWGLAVIPSGRSLAHSLLTAAAVCALVYHVAAVRGRRREIGVAFAVGYLSHLAGDALRPALEGSYAELGFLLWPLSPAPAYDEPVGVRAVLAALAETEITGAFLVQFGAAAVLGCLLLVHFLRFASWGPAEAETEREAEAE